MKGYGEERAWGRLMIPDLIRRGLGSNAIIRELANITGTWRRSVMLQDIRQFSGLMKLERAVRALSPDRLPTKAHMVESDLRRARKYRVYGTLTVENTETGETTTKTVSMYTNDLKSKTEWENDYLDPHRLQGYTQGITLQGLEIKSIEHNKGFAY